MMKWVMGTAAGVAVLLARSAVSNARHRAEDDEDTVAARKAVLDVVEAVEAGKGDKDLAAKAEAIKKKDVELNNLMKVYKLKGKGGLGYGAKPDATSGIEKKLLDLSQKAPAKGALKKEAKDLIKLAHLNIAMAEIAKPHFQKAMEGKGKKDWDAWLKDQKTAAKELIEAVKKEDADGVSKAAKNMVNSCNECHAVFRK
jgi:hypothetical protein